MLHEGGMTRYGRSSVFPFFSFFIVLIVFVARFPRLLRGPLSLGLRCRSGGFGGSLKTKYDKTYAEGGGGVCGRNVLIFIHVHDYIFLRCCGSEGIE